MKIANAILSVNDNAGYQRFWPLVAELWKAMGIQPWLFWTTTSREPFPFPSEHGVIIQLSCLDFENGDYQYHSSILARIFGATAVPGMNILTDIDLLPISKAVFTADFEPRRLSILNVEPAYHAQFSKWNINHYVGHDSVFQELLLTRAQHWKKLEWDASFVEEVHYWTTGDRLPKTLPANQIYTYSDEYFLTRKLAEYWEPVLIPARSRLSVSVGELPTLNIEGRTEAHLYLSNGSLSEESFKHVVRIAEDIKKAL